MQIQANAAVETTVVAFMARASVSPCRILLCPRVNGASISALADTREAPTSVAAARVDRDGVYMCEQPLGRLVKPRLDFPPQRVVRLRIGSSPNARHVGGLNWFGRACRDYPEDLTLRLEYEPGRCGDHDTQLTPTYCRWSI